MKKFTVSCDFGGQMAPFTIYIGKPQDGNHPLHFQADWLSKNRGGMIPGEVMDAIAQLQELSEKNNVPLEELCVYALGSEEQQAELEAEKSKNFDDTFEGSGDLGAENTLSDKEEMEEEKHIVVDQHEHAEKEEAEDMTSEGGHIEDDERG